MAESTDFSRSRYCTKKKDFRTNLRIFSSSVRLLPPPPPDFSPSEPLRLRGVNFFGYYTRNLRIFRNSDWATLCHVLSYLLSVCITSYPSQGTSMLVDICSVSHILLVSAILHIFQCLLAFSRMLSKKIIWV